MHNNEVKLSARHKNTVFLFYFKHIRQKLNVFNMPICINKDSNLDLNKMSQLKFL